MEPRPAGPSEGVTALLTPKLEVETNFVPATVLSGANAQTGAALNPESMSNAPTNLRDPRATFHLQANHRQGGSSLVQVKQEPKQEPIEAEHLANFDPALPLSPPPQPGISLVQGMLSSMLSKLFDPFEFVLSHLVFHSCSLGHYLNMANSTQMSCTVLKLLMDVRVFAPIFLHKYCLYISSSYQIMN